MDVTTHIFSLSNFLTFIQYSSLLFERKTVPNRFSKKNVHRVGLKQRRSLTGSSKGIDYAIVLVLLKCLVMCTLE